MKYMLLINCARNGYSEYLSMAKQDIERHVAYMRAFGRRVSEAGEFIATVGLAAPTDAKLVRAGGGGKPVTDGVFPEMKEYLAGYWIVDVDSPQRAYELAAEISAAPGVGGAPSNDLIEVREVMTEPHT